MSGPAAVGLEPITPATAARILSRDERTGDRWHAAAHGALRAIADTAEDNVASLRVLAKAGMIETARRAGTVFFSRELSAGVR